MFNLLGLLSPKSFVFPIAAIILAVAGLYAWTSQRIITDLRNEVVQLEVSKAQLQSAITEQQNTIDFLEKQAKLIQKEFEETERAFAQTRRDAENLKEQLQAVEVDKLSIESPSAAELSINDTTAKFDRCFELLSGAPLNDTEKAATNGQELNSMCPWIFDDLKR